MKLTKAGRYYQAHDIKICRKCQCELIDGNNFNLSLAKYQNWICNPCKNKYDLELKAIKPFRNHEASIKKYGLTAQEYERLYKEQDGCCKICKDSAPLHSNNRTRLYVDHCHDTKKVRGLLCKNCNSGLGQFRENIKTMEDAIQYLKDSN